MEELRKERNTILALDITKAIFLNQNIVVYPQGETPSNLNEVVKFLFGENCNSESGLGRKSLQLYQNYGR